MKHAGSTPQLRITPAALSTLAGLAIAAMAVAFSIPDAVAGTSAGARDGNQDGVGRLLRLRERLQPQRRKTRHPAIDVPSRGRPASTTARHGRCFPTDVEAAIAMAASRYRIDPNLIRAVISVESSGNPRAISNKGARGLMQVMPATGRDLGVHDAALLFDVSANVTAGTRYLRYTYDRFGNWPQAIGAYNAGPASIARGRIPTETRHYVRRVLARHRDYRLSRCG
ncbi:MAG: lytic transglycosylase domain-containing protein [Candidatus Binatia bacterium]